MKEFEFKPFDKVLGRSNDAEPWLCDFYSYYDQKVGNPYHYICIGDIYSQCIPYEGNEHLVGTTDLIDWNVERKVEIFKGWVPQENETYKTISYSEKEGKFIVVSECWMNSIYDNRKLKRNEVFVTPEEAQLLCNKLNKAIEHVK